MRHLQKIDLAAAVSAATEVGTELTLSELVRAYGLAVCDGSDLRLKKWTDAFGSRSAWSLQPEELEAAVQAMLAHGYAPATTNRDLSSLGSVYRWAKVRRLSPRGFKSPTLGITRLAEPVRRIHLEASDIERLRARSLAFPDRRFGVFVALLIDTGARKSELLERFWKEVDVPERQILAPTTKNGSPRVLFFSDRTAQLLDRVYPRRKPDELVFEGRNPGEPISFRRAWSVLVREVGLPNLHMHDLRHAAAANLLKAGVTLGVAAQVLGHDPAVLARRYGHLETKALREAQKASWSQQAV